jgi:hypothetical protein
LGSFKSRIISSASRNNWLLPFLFLSLLFISLVLLLSVGVQALYWKNGESGHILFLIPDFSWNDFSFSPIYYNVGYRFVILPLLCWGTFLLFPFFFRDFIRKQRLHDEFCQRLFIYPLRWSGDFCPWFYLCTVLCILICVCWTNLACLEWNQLDYGIWSL